MKLAGWRKRAGARRRVLGTAVLILLLIVLGVGIWARWRPARQFDPGEPRAGEFRLATWNVGYFAPAVNKNVRDFDIDGIADTLKGLSAHVVILQELDSKDQANEIARGLGGDWRALSVKTGHHRQVLAVLSRLNMGDAEINEAGGRRMIGVPLHDGEGRDIFILGIHSPHPVRGPRDTIENIRGAVSMVAGRKEAIRIIAGDFNYNFEPDGSDAGGNSLYREILGVLSDSTASIGETYYAHTRIDHVFHYPKELRVIEENSGMVDLSFRFAKAPGFRDHRPIVVSFETGRMFSEP